MFSVESMQAGLNTEFLGRNVQYIASTNSTNDDVWNSFQNGNPNGTLIISEQQKRGRGRRKNTWYAIPNKSLIFSFLFLPEVPLEKIGLLPLLAGVSIVKGIHMITNILPGLKWPNDIMLDQKKMGGILIESRTTNQGACVAVGIGLNINESPNDFSENLKNQATSLLIYSGKESKREIILSSILNEFENLYFHSWQNITSLWEKYCIHKNNTITFHNGEELFQGNFQGITNTGYAKIKLNGKTKIFPAGMITL